MAGVILCISGGTTTTVTLRNKSLYIALSRNVADHIRLGPEHRGVSEIDVGPPINGMIEYIPPPSFVP